MVLRKTLLVKGREYYEQHLRVLNIMFPVKMTDREIEFLACYMSFGLFGGMDKGIRDNIMGCMGISTSGISNLLSSLREKGFIRGKGSDFVLFDKLRVNEVEQEYHIKLINDR